MTTSSFSEGGHAKGPSGRFWFRAETCFRTVQPAPNRADNPFGGASQRPSPVADGRLAEVTPNHLKLSDPGRHEDPYGRRPRRPTSSRPLNRGAMRGARGQHERPVEGPATGMAADPTAGCGVSGDGYGYPDHVSTFLLAKRVLGRPQDPSHKVLRPRGPSRLAQGRSTGPLSFWINAGDHPTVPAELCTAPGHTCRKAQHPLTSGHNLVPPCWIRASDSQLRCSRDTCQ